MIYRVQGRIICCRYDLIRHCLMAFSMLQKRGIWEGKCCFFRHAYVDIIRSHNEADKMQGCLKVAHIFLYSLLAGIA